MSYFFLMYNYFGIFVNHISHAMSTSPFYDPNGTKDRQTKTNKIKNVNNAIPHDTLLNLNIHLFDIFGRYSLYAYKNQWLIKH